MIYEIREGWLAISLFFLAPFCMCLLNSSSETFPSQQVCYYQKLALPLVKREFTRLSDLVHKPHIHQGDSYHDHIFDGVRNDDISGFWNVYMLDINLDAVKRRKVVSVVEHSSTNPKVPFPFRARLIPGSWIMTLEWSTTSQRLWVYTIPVPYAQKENRFLFEKRRGATPGVLVSRQ